MEKNEKLFVIKKISWERIFLNMEIDIPAQIKENVELFLENQKRVRIPLEMVRTEDELIFSINIACVQNRKFLDNGRWFLIAQCSTGEEYICKVCADVAYKFDDLSRIFKYAQNQMAYTISFGVMSEDENTLDFYIDSYFMEENNSWEKRRYVKEVRGIKAKIKRAFMYAFILVLRCLYKVSYALSVKKGNRVLIMSETKDYLWGNLKFIDERIKERGLDKEFKIDYSFRKASGNNQGIKDIFKWFALIIKISRQGYIFVDDYVQIFGFFKLGKKTKLIQVWHAGEGFKSVGYSRFGKDGSPFPEGSCHKQYTHVITGSEHLVDVFREVFGIEKEAFYPVGMPRLDNFLDIHQIDKYKKYIYEMYPELKNRKVILFAPTYRGIEQKVAYYDYDKLDLKQIYEFCRSNGYMFVIKMHPFIKEKMQIPESYAEYIMDLSSYPNINELYYVTDLLITDYSSNYFEYVLLKRPVVFYTYDRELYELTRGVHRSIKESAPGKVCDTFVELMRTLEDGDYEFEKTEKFVEDNFKSYKGRASDKVIDIILLNKMD